MKTPEPLAESDHAVLVAGVFRRTLRMYEKVNLHESLRVLGLANENGRINHRGGIACGEMNDIAIS